MPKSILVPAFILLIFAQPAAHAQFGGLAGGIINALPTVINGVTKKITAQDPNSIQGINRADAERNFEEQTRGMSAEQKAALRQQYEMALSASNGAVDIHRASAKVAQEAPMFDTGAILGSFLGGVVQNQAMWGQVGAASAMNHANVSNNVVAGVLGAAGVPNASGAYSTINAANPIGNVIGGIFRQVAGATQTSNDYDHTAFLGVDIREGTRDQVNAALTQRGILATGVEPALSDIALLLNAPKLDTNPSRVKVGFEPILGKIALVSYEYDNGGNSRFDALSKQLLRSYGQPTGQSNDNGLAKYEWKIAEGEGYVLSRISEAVSISYQHGQRYQLMSEAWSRATAKPGKADMASTRAVVR